MEQSTHILVNYTGQNSEILFRAGDGIAIGQRKGTVVVYGEDPNRKTSRVFLDDEHAQEYLRTEVARLDLAKDGPFARVRGYGLSSEALPALEGEFTPVIEPRDGEVRNGVRLVIPDGVMELPGGLRNFN